MSDLQGMFKEAWSQALLGLSAAEQEAEKVLGRIADAAGFTPEDVRRHARDFGERLRAQRRDMERSIDEAVRRATGRLRFPSRDEVASLRQRVDELAARLDEMSREREKRAG